LRAGASRTKPEFQAITDGDPEYARVEVVGESSELTMKTDRKALRALIST
jgi:hypothetical protein